MFHNKFGKKITSATPPPASSHGVHSSFRCGEISNPSNNAAAKNPIEYLFSSPSPPIAPNAIHNRTSPVRIIRSNTNAHPVQNSASNAFIANW